MELFYQSNPTNISQGVSMNYSEIQRVYYHGSCPDGITSREILKQQYKDTVEYIPYYFTEFKEIPKNAIFVDCCPKEHQVEDVLKNGGVIIDHHESVKDLLLKLSIHYCNQIIFDTGINKRSGALLAHSFLLYVGKTIPAQILNTTGQYAHYISIGDTWQVDNPDFAFARKLGKFITFFGNNFSIDFSIPMNKELIEQFGNAEMRRQRAYAKSAINTTYIGVGNIFFINQLNMSDAAEILRNERDADLVVGWEFKIDYDNKPTIVYSLRSKENGFDCSVFAKKNGGGGHKAAAGFSYPIELAVIDEVQPIGMFLDLL